MLSEAWPRRAAETVESDPAFDRVADGIDGATVEIVDDIDHSPTVENPAMFREYPLRALSDAVAD